MNELLECKDLLRNERVIAANKGLGTGMWSDVWGHSNWPEEVVAFQMRDACFALGIHRETDWGCQIRNPDVRGDLYKFNPPRPMDWIIAATLAWEATK